MLETTLAKVAGKAIFEVIFNRSPENEEQALSKWRAGSWRAFQTKILEMVFAKSLRQEGTWSGGTEKANVAGRQ